MLSINLFSTIILILIVKSFGNNIVNNSEVLKNKTSIFSEFMVGIHVIKTSTPCGHNRTQDIDNCVNNNLIHEKLINEKESDKKHMCCAVWDTVYCIESVLVCSETDYKIIVNIIEAIQRTAEFNNCVDYELGSYSCHLPVWTVVIISLCALLFVTIAVFVVFKKINRNKMNKI